MPSFNLRLPSLVILPSNSAPDQQSIHPTERTIDRNILLDVAPDRESLIMSDRSIDDIRQWLKLRVLSSDGHWLYRAQRRREVKLRDATARMSAYGRAGALATDENAQEVTQPIQIIRRRALSSFSTNTFAMSGISAIENRLASLDIHESEAWGNLALSAEDKLISPRPLGLTHLLLVYSTGSPSTAPRYFASDHNTVLRRKPGSGMAYPEVLEVPINDLLFLINVSNLVSSSTQGRSMDSPILPRRLHKELPRVLIQVPHLETFPELIIYLHTKNQAELFRKLIPEWMRDLIYPLPTLLGSRNVHSVLAPFDGRNVRRLLGILVHGSSSDSSLDTIESTSTSMSHDLGRRTIASVAKEIAEDSQLNQEVNGPSDLLVRTAAQLDALRDNLYHLGYFGKDLWNELDVSREILLRAISWKARIENEVD